jgi:hypothetical protein
LLVACLIAGISTVLQVLVRAHVLIASTRAS